MIQITMLDDNDDDGYADSVGAIIMTREEQMPIRMVNIRDIEVIKWDGPGPGERPDHPTTQFTLMDNVFNDF